MMIFIETPIFTADLNEFLTDDEYTEFQQYLADNPRSGEVIQDTGGLRKVVGLLMEKEREEACE